MDTQRSFEAMLEKHKTIVERYINYRMPCSFDADDVIQETYFAAFMNFDKLQNPDAFKKWILSIARNQCNLWYRKKYGTEYIPLESIIDTVDTHELSYDDTVSSILRKLPHESANVLQMIMDGYKQSQIADKLGVPFGTVKSRVHYAKKLFRAACSPEISLMYKRGKNNMSKKNYTCGFPMEMPALTIKEKNVPFFEVKFEEEAFIIPRIGNKNSEGTYRYPSKKLALVSTCYVPKAATVHEVAGVKVCRDTYNIKAGKLYKNECIWFSQLTDEYIRDLATIACDCEADDDYPTAIYTFLEEDYDVKVNGNDRVHGRPLLIKENPPKIEDGKIVIDEYNIRYTMGTFDVTIGKRTFETIKFINVQSEALVTENYVDRNGRLVLLRWYESMISIENDDYYTEELIKRIENNPTITVNGIKYILIEDRIGEYVL